MHTLLTGLDENAVVFHQAFESRLDHVLLESQVPLAWCSLEIVRALGRLVGYAHVSRSDVALRLLHENLLIQIAV